MNVKPKALKLLVLAVVVSVATAFGPALRAQGADPIQATKGKAINMVLLPKFLGIAVFDQANQGAQEAHTELGNTGKLEFLGPTPENSVAGQIEIIKAATTRGVNAIMISNNAGDQLVPSTKDALAKGMKVVSWDSPIAPDGENLFVAQVDFAKLGTTMADMALDILGPDGGDWAFLSASPDAANQNAWIAATKDALKDPKYAKIHLVDTVYGNDKSEDSYKAAQGLVDKYPNLKLIMSPTTVGAPAASKFLQDEKLCDKIKVSGLALPSEMESYVKNDCAPEFALWSFVDLGYLTYYTTYMLAAGDLKGVAGESFVAGRMGTYTIEEDPSRKGGLRIIMGPFTIYNKDNIDAAVGSPAATMDASMAATMEATTTK
ncbi:MAG: rhamnose ABC transporter substrate-binding protein [Chloroflexota bacterium]